jgi:hypothetical protein
MRRAIAVTVLILVGAAFMAAGVKAQGKIATRVNAIGLIDYAVPHTFKPGDWVRYRITGESELGMRDDYDLTVLIAGEELFWGDSCFWVETWIDPKGGPPLTIAAMMGYSIFKDPEPLLHMQMYQRKQVNEINEDGSVKEVVMAPGTSVLQSRSLFKKPLTWDIDTLGADTVITPVGQFDARKVSFRQGTGTTRTTGDSTRYDEVRENRMVWVNFQVPITHVARESVENIIARRTWMIGRSGEATPLLLRERGLGSARLIGAGSGLAPRLLPPNRRFPSAVAQQVSAKPAAKKPAAKKPPAAKPAAAKPATGGTKP